MGAHRHDLGTTWPFDDAENAKTYSCRHVIDEGHPILRVAHDDDGDWQVLCGEPHIVDDGRIVCLGCMVVRDRTLLELADLPHGWGADRDRAGDPWVRESCEGEE